MFANRFTAVIDACVLYSPLKRNLILSLAEVELYRIGWSEEILLETQCAIEKYLVKKGCENPSDRAGRACDAMRKAFPDAAIADYESLKVNSGQLPDEGDVHVVAAAIKAKANIIVTENVKDFPASIVSGHGIEVKTADEFIADAIDLNPLLAISAIKRMRLRFQKPGMTPDALLLHMEQIGLTLSAAQLKDSISLI